MKRSKIYLIFLIVVILFFCTWNYRWYGYIGFGSPKWNDSIKINGIMYNAEYVDDIHKEIDKNEIDENYSKILFTLRGNIRNSLYVMRNNDATLLPKGTIIYTIKEGQSDEEVAAKIGDKYYSYIRSNME